MHSISEDISLRLRKKYKRHIPQKGSFIESFYGIFYYYSKNRAYAMIGEGSYGTVYRAVNTATKHVSAVKVISMPRISVCLL